MSSKEEFKYEFGKEYPERETRGTVWYPPSFKRLSANDIWQEKKGGFYVHIPFCKSICKYCPFNKYAWKSDEYSNSYLEALKKEIKLVTEKPYLKDFKISAGYFGGGTPTSLNTEQLIDLINYCKENFNLQPKAEMSIEANPETVDEYKLHSLLEIGINRISFGVQSFNNHFLEVLGRAGRVKDAISAIKLAQKIGFNNIGIDLLYCIPGQTLLDWEKDLHQALDLGLQHISTMALSLDPGTALFEEYITNKVSPQPSEELDIAMYEKAMQILTDYGYHQYTMYDFALPGKECIHHAINWQAPQKEYVGLGAGACSFLRSYIYLNHNALDEYISSVNQGQIPISLGRKLSVKDEMTRYMVLGVYFLEVEKEKFKDRFGMEIEKVFGETLEKLEKWGLIINKADSVSLTHKGKVFVYSVSNAFYSEEHKYKPQPVGVELQKKKGITLQGIQDI